jgi:hypothetical protein
MIAPHLIQSFWKRVDRGEPAECWPWLGAKGDGRYGHTYIGGGRDSGRFATAHRVAYELARGPIPAGLTIDHLCGNRLCVNPAHLEAVTQKENSQRAYATICRNGLHRRTPENTTTQRSGGRTFRVCLPCREARIARRRDYEKGNEAEEPAEWEQDHGGYVLVADEADS